MKKTTVLSAVMISAVLTACSPKEAVVPVTKAETTAEATTTEKTEKEEIPAVKIEDTAQRDYQPEQSSDEGYEDNFAVDPSAASAYADKIKAAVAAKDIEALADLTAFPVYVGIAEGGVETREDFIALGAEKIFTPELVSSIEGADTSDLPPSMAGFSISKDGKANIIFGVVEGKLAISGINY